MKQTVLILGSKGSLAQEIIKIYSDQDIVAYDRDKLDITDETAVAKKIAKLKPQLIINCAAYNAVDKAEEDAETANKINGHAVGYIAKAAKEVGATVVHYSTGYVFDGNDPGGYNEEAEPNPQSAYAKSKLLGEAELKKNTDSFYLIRTAWLYGGKAGKKSFPDIMLEKAAESTELSVVIDEFGSPTLVKDLAQATRALIEMRNPFGIYHLTNDGYTNWYGWAQKIFDMKGLNIKLNKVNGKEFKRPAARPQYGIIHNTKFIHLRPWQEALEEYLTSF